MSERVIAIVQARMGSTRFPGKIMMDLCGFPVLQWVLERVKKAQALSATVLATTTESEDDCLMELANGLNVPVFRGSEKDVLKRFVETARKHHADIIVRVCADNPLVAPEEIDRIVSFYQKERPDYAFNHIPRQENNYPDGLGAEVFSIELLEQLNEIATQDKYREHSTLYLWDYIEQFTIKTIPCPNDFADPKIKLDIDTAEDLDKLNLLCCRLNFDSTPIEIVRRWYRAC